jgi:hypothetical protein
MVEVRVLPVMDRIVGAGRENRTRTIVHR